MVTIESLPNEILYQIAAHLHGCRENQPALKSLCSTSRRFKAIAEASLYSYFNDGIETGQDLLQGFDRRRKFLRSILKRPELSRYTKYAVVGPWRCSRDFLYRPPWIPEKWTALLLAASRLGLDSEPEWQRRIGNKDTEHAELYPEGIEDAELYLLLCSLPSLESLTLAVPELAASYWWSSRMSAIHTSLRSVTIIAPDPSYGEISFEPRCSLPRFLELPALEVLTLSGCRKIPGTEVAAEPYYFWNTPGLRSNSTVKHLVLDNPSLRSEHIRGFLRATPNLTSFSYDRGGDQYGYCINPKRILELLYPFRQQLQRLALHISKINLWQPRGTAWPDFKVSNATGIHREEGSLRMFTKLKELCLDMFVVTGPGAYLVHEDVLVHFLPPRLRSLSLINGDTKDQDALRKLVKSGPVLFPELEDLIHVKGITKVRDLP